MSVRKRYIFAAIGFTIAFIIQTTLLKHFTILGWSPNLILCLVVVCSFLYDEKIGIIYGFVFGLLLDFITNIYIGPSAIAFTIIYLVALLIRHIFNYEKLLPALLLAAVSTPVYLLVIWICQISAGSPASILLVLRALPVQLVYNGVIIILLHLVLVRGVVKHRRDASFTGGFRINRGLKI